MGGTGRAGFTDEGMFCANALGRLLIFPELVGAGIPPTVMLDLAMSASACRILVVSGAGAAPVAWGIPLSGIEFFGGELVGVVD